MPSGRPTLVWPGKARREPVRPARLVEEPGRGHGVGDNRLVRGDNLPVLAALAPEFAGRVHCVYIDPPYNTGAGVSHYDDALDESAWLSSLRDRLEAIRPLLADRGVVFVSIDDDRAAWVELLMEEVFGRGNRLGRLVWEKKRKPSFRDQHVASVTEAILAYARCRRAAPPLVAGTTTRGKRYPLNNVGNGLRVLAFPAGAVAFGFASGVFAPQDMSAGRVVTRLLDPLVVAGGVNRGPFRLEGEWRYSQATLDRLLAAGDRIVVSRAPFRPNHVRDGGEPKRLVNLLAGGRYGVGTYEDAAEEGRRLFGDAGAFDYPKPESLVAALLAAVTAPGDLVLDCFAGSGTTGAVAHKLRRAWILVESGPQCDTHVAPRLARVVDGADPGGITAAAGWTGGGGFRYFTAMR